MAWSGQFPLRVIPPFTSTFFFSPIHFHLPLAFLSLPDTLSICGPWPSTGTTNRVLLPQSSVQMDRVSLTIPPHPTIPLSLSPIPFPPSSNPTSFLPPSSYAPQNIAMSGVVRNKAASGAGAQPPRPPNAWILYRSDKLQELPPPPVGHPKPTQAEVSKIISAQWRAETDDVRATYEQRAETAKAEHARLYPNYRFAPMKRADKDRIREEKRQAKEQERAGRRVRARVAPYPSPSTASPFNASSPLIIKHVVPNAQAASPSMSSSSSLSSTTPASQPCVNVAPYYSSTRVSSDAFTDLRFQPVDSQSLSFHESLRLRTNVQPEVPLNFIFQMPQPPPPKGWPPSPSDSPTADLSPLPDLMLPEWPQPSPSEDQSQQACAIPSSFSLALLMFYHLQICALHFTMPSYESNALQNELILAAVRSTAIPGVFPLHSLANGDITVPPPDNIDMGMGMYPSSMCGSTAFDDPLRLLGENPETFMSNPTVDQLVATINTLTESQQPQENVSPSSSDPVSIDPTQAFNLDDFVKDFGVSAPQECESLDALEERVQEREQSITTTLSVISRDSPATPSSHSESVASPMPSFYVATSSPAPTQPTPAPTPPLAKHPYASPCGAANAGNRRVGGTWKVPMAVSRIASPIPRSAASPNQVLA